MVSSRVLISLVMAFVMVASSEAHGGSNWWWWNKPTKIPTTVPTTCNNEPGLWFNGTTLSVFYSSCLSKCCAACQADPACYSYSYSKRRQECYKVGASTVRVYDSNCKRLHFYNIFDHITLRKTYQPNFSKIKFWYP